MKSAFSILFLLFCSVKVFSLNNNTDSLPAMFTGNFTDDYKIQYTITDSLWIQHPGIKYHIIYLNIEEGYLLAQNDENNPGDKKLFTRIDIMKFEKMEPYRWGFCLTTYNASTPEEALKNKADKKNPKNGCNGYPFSRMKRAE